MRAAGITALGEPVEIFEVDELATPAASEVLIDVVAVGIGNWDELVRIGSWQIGGPAPMGARDGGGRDGRSGRLRRGRATRG
jgi:Zn-dependent alcohol dehydrogenase